MVSIIYVKADMTLRLVLTSIHMYGTTGYIV